MHTYVRIFVRREERVLMMQAGLIELQFEWRVTMKCNAMNSV